MRLLGRHRAGAPVVLAASLTLIASGAGATPVTLDFEGVPLTYHYHSGNQNLGNSYPGHPEVTFGPDATILETTDPCCLPDYLPHSGTAVLFSYNSTSFSGGTAHTGIDITFSTPIDNPSIWYTTTTDLTLEAYSDTGLTTLLGTTSAGGPNLGTSSVLSLSLSGIRGLRVHDGGNGFVVDDLSYTVVPESPSLVLVSAGLIGLALMGSRRRRGAGAPATTPSRSAWFETLRARIVRVGHDGSPAAAAAR